MALTNTEVAIMNEHDFKSLWEYQKIKEKERIVFNLKANSYLGEFCEQTIYMIAYEFLEERTFMPGTMILAQSKRSPLNLFYKEYFQNMISNFGMKLTRSCNLNLLKNGSDIKILVASMPVLSIHPSQS